MTDCGEEEKALEEAHRDRVEGPVVDLDMLTVAEARPDGLLHRGIRRIVGELRCCRTGWGVEVEARSRAACSVKVVNFYELNQYGLVACAGGDGIWSEACSSNLVCTSHASISPPSELK